MKKFQHRTKWFVIYKSKAPSWIGSGFVVHTPPDINTLKQNKELHTYYIQEDDSLWQITLEDLLKHREMYNNRYHIDRDFLSPIEITEEWRKEIERYKFGN